MYPPTMDPSAAPPGLPQMPPIGAGQDPQSALLQQLLAGGAPGGQEPQVTVPLTTLLSILSGGPSPMAGPPGIGGPPGLPPDMPGDDTQDAAALPPGGPPGLPPGAPPDLMAAPEGAGAGVPPLGPRMDKAMKDKPPEKKKAGQGKK